MELLAADPTLAAAAVQPDRRPWKAYLRPGNIPFYGFHLVPIVGIAISGWSWSGFAIAMALYYVRLFFITGAYHRYFAHRTYKTSRAFQFLLALGGTCTAQKGVLWWASHHRNHHRLSDKPGDVHSVRQGGLFWSHMGWIAVADFDETQWDKIKDFAKFPELRWLNKYNMVPPVVLAVGMFALGGWHLLLWGFFFSTVIAWHGTFTINSLSHLFGTRRYDTDDDSKNNFALAIITMGEGWHNNHHHYQNACNQGWRWYEIDATYYVLRAMQAVGLVWDIRKAPAHIVAGTRRHAKIGPATTATATAALDEAA